MAAIFDFRETRMSDSISVSLPELPDPENMGIALDLSLLSCREAEIYVISFLLPANGRHIWFPRNRMSDSISASLSVLPDSENIGIALDLSLLSCREADIYVISFLLPVNGRHLWFPTYPDVGQSFHLSSHVAFVRKHGLAVGMSLPSCI